MSEFTIYNGFIYLWFGLSAAVFFYLMKNPAPYGRHGGAGWGPTIGNKAGWVLMEIPSVVLFAYLFAIGRNKNAAAIFFFLMWETHYVYRTFVFSMLLRGRKRMPLVIVGSGFLFNIVNAYINGRYLFTFADAYPASWFAGSHFLIGFALFAAGFVIHVSADRTLRNLRKPGETGFKIPHGGLFRFVSSPNYLGEMIQWIGFAVATWSLPGLAFAVWTFANLFPRTLKHHEWYHQNFGDRYPRLRKAIIPFIL